jgi:hypothetical protein
MSSDLSRFLRAVKTLAKLAWKYPDDAWTEALGPYATVKQEGEVWFVGPWLSEIADELDRRRQRRGDARPCSECGKDILNNIRYDNRGARSDARYCSPKCKQKAYRKRAVTARAHATDNKRNELKKRYGSPPQKHELSVTGAP